MAIDYRFTAEGTIEQQDPDGSYSVHTLMDTGPLGKEKTLFDTQVARWWPLAISNQDRTGVPAPLTEAVIFSESGGDPTKHGPAADPGIGLTMITMNSLKEGLSDDQVYVPENNIMLATDFMKTLGARLGSYDPVQIASMYNCGPAAHGAKPMAKAPWGYCEYETDTGAFPYISKIVRSYNYAVQTMPLTSSTRFRTALKIVGGLAAVGLAAYIGMAIADPEILPARVRKAIA